MDTDKCFYAVTMNAWIEMNVEAGSPAEAHQIAEEAVLVIQEEDPCSDAYITSRYIDSTERMD